MKIDLAGERDRGLAMGLNEFAGYLAVALAALASGWIAGNYGLRPFPFYLGIGLSAAGLLATLFLVKDTHAHVETEAAVSKTPRLKRIFWDTTWGHKNLGSVTLTGLVNNLNDGMVWGLLPLMLAQRSFSLSETGLLAAVYPAVWGVSQIFTGRLSDYVCKKDLLMWGMILQGVALFGVSYAEVSGSFVFWLSLLGFGTALVYPTFLASIADNTHPHDRAHSLGIFRFWRDMGYAAGALLCGILADYTSIPYTFLLVGILTILTGMAANYRMKCKTDHPLLWLWVKSGLSSKHNKKSAHFARTG